MVKKVLKFGGTSVGTIERIQHVANIIQKEHLLGNQVIAVVSAMSGRTNELSNISKKISEKFNKREFDVLLSSGEQVTSALLAGALIELKIVSATTSCPIRSSKIWGLYFRAKTFVFLFIFLGD